MKGFPEGDGYVLVTEAELENVAAEKTKAMDVIGFCAFDDVDPKWLGLADFLGPVDNTIYRPYMLFYQTMRDLELCALVTYNGYGRTAGPAAVPGPPRCVLPNEVRLCHSGSPSRPSSSP